MHRIVSDESLDTLFRTACSHQAWLNRPVSDTLLRALWELVKLGPTSDKSRPARILFIRSDEAKERLAPTLPPNERAVAQAAPVTAIIASERGTAVGAGLADAEAPPRALAVRDGALRGAYLILAARALGLDCRPIWDFQADAIEAAFLSKGMATFLCALGYGDDAQRELDRPRTGFDAASQIL